ncbi:MAG TPA: hypothetical protein VMA34_10780 [Terracidiphilus sp.]|nr:hypothetical protein [Terracidiphilus sp.]
MNRKKDRENLLQSLIARLKRITGPPKAEPDDPYAYVTAPLRRPPGRGGAAATVELDAGER